MKNLILILCLVLSTPVLAQTKIKASDIIKQINEGRAVDYTNADIDGDLDFTHLDNERVSGDWPRSFGNVLYKSTVEVPVKFTGCTFSGDILAYYPAPHDRETHIANFDKDVVFKDCVFKHASEFKYTEFNTSASFEGCTFSDVANFKYAHFTNGPMFNGSNFKSGADFKYTKFPSETSFEKATFHGFANFKYTKFNSPLNLKGVAFEGSEDFKYTKIDGKSFTSYLARN